MNTRLPGDTSLGSVSLTTTDLSGLESYYRDGLGMQLVEREPGYLALGVEGEAPILHLIEDPDARPAPRQSGGLYHFAVLLPDREALAGMQRRLIAKGIHLDGAADHLVNEALYLSDPQGNGIEIYTDRARDVWRSADGELKMATLPLDVEGLLSLAGLPLINIPAGTTLGHIHLYVTDLEAAVEFYEEVVGFDLIMRNGLSAAFLSSGGYHHHLGLNTWQGEGAPAPPQNSIGLREYTLIIKHADAWSEVRQRMTAAQVGDPERFSAIDPSGHTIVFVRR